MTPTYPSLGELAPDEIVRAAQDHYENSVALAFAGNPKFSGDANFGHLLTGLPSPMGNMVVGTNLPKGETDVVEVTAKLKNLGVPGLWWLGPNANPKNLGELLIGHGWTGPNPMPAMMVDLCELKDTPLPAETEIRPVVSREDLGTWHAVVAEGFGMAVEVARVFDLPNAQVGKFYTAYSEGKPVAVSAVFFNGGIAGIYCVATISEFRGRGLGSAITVIPLLEAAKGGYKIGTLQASTMGHPVYERLGFKDVMNVDIYFYGLPPKN